MNERQKRLIMVYNHLRRFYDIHTKTGFAEAIHYGRTSLSAAMNGDESYLTDNLFKNICEVFPDVFNLDYLLTGQGNLFLDKTEPIEKTEKERKEIDQSSLVNAALAAKDQVIAQLELRISEKDVTIRTQQRLIQVLERRISEIEFKHKDYPFPVGVADQITSESDV